MEAIRDALAVSLSSAEPQNVAALTKELRATLAELAGLPAQVEGDPVADALAKLADRHKGAANPRKATKRPVAAAGKRVHRPS